MDTNSTQLLLQGKKAYCFVVSRQSGIAATVMTNAEYPERVAINFLDMLLDEFSEIYGNKISQSVRKTGERGGVCVDGFRRGY